MAPKAFNTTDLHQGQSFGVKQTIYQGSGCISKIPEILEAEEWNRILLVADRAFSKLAVSLF
jgi:alcohol dehydrogenase class IV